MTGLAVLGAARGALRRGDIHVWWIALSDVSPMALPAADRHWIDASVEPILAERRRRSRTALRQLIGRYLDRPSAELIFERGDHGKPRLAGGDLAFNLSHSDDLMVLAIAEDGELGVDIDRLDRLEDAWERVAKVALSPAERADLGQLADADRGAATMRVWIRKEAYTKGLGTGFAARFSSIDVGLASRPTLMSVSGDEKTRGTAWRVADLAAPLPWAAAIACQHAGEQITNWHYP